MADTEHTTSRRSMLGALAVAPLLASATFASTSPSTEWDAHWAAYQAAVREHRDFDLHVWTPAYETEEAYNATIGNRHGTPGYWERRKENHSRFWADGVEDRMDELSDRVVDRWRRLLRLPAPDKKALRWKLDEALSDDGPLSDETLSVVRADIARLLGDA